MIRIELDGIDRLARLTRAPRERAQRAGVLAAKRAAEDYVEAIRDWQAAGRAYRDRTGILSQSIGWRGDGNGALVYAQAPYAGFVEYGTRPHVIRPRPGRKALRWYPAGGGMLFARSVKHPGTNPRPFFFADFERRRGVMLAAAREAMAEVLLS